jgi:hypothetical protein
VFFVARPMHAWFNLAEFLEASFRGNIPTYYNVVVQYFGLKTQNSCILETFTFSKIANVYDNETVNPSSLNRHISVFFCYVRQD